MKVQVVQFPETKVAVIEHRGSPALEDETARKLIAWKLQQRLSDPFRYRSYGVHHTDPRSTPAAEHRVDFCLSVETQVEANPFGIFNGVIPANRCAIARDVGSRHDNQAAVYLFESWLPQSGETAASFPVFFHYVNVGPNVQEADMITDVYLPLR